MGFPKNEDRGKIGQQALLRKEDKWPLNNPVMRN